MPEQSPLNTIPESRPARWALLMPLIATWYRPVAPGDGYDQEALRESETRRGVPLPLAIREWYGASGRRDDVWSRQDTVITPDKLVIDKGILEFYVENQGVTSWAVRESELGLDDPPVIVRDENDDWVVQSPTFSEFAIHMFTFSVQSGKHPAQIHGFAHPTCAQRLQTGLPKLGFPEFIWTRSSLFGFNDLIVCIDGTDHVSASALNSEAMQRFRRMIDSEDFEVICAVGDADSNGT